MAGGQQLPEQYTVPQLAKVFHGLPHLNVSLHSVNNTFNPHSEIYLEVNAYNVSFLFYNIVNKTKSRFNYIMHPIILKFIVY